MKHNGEIKVFVKCLCVSWKALKIKCIIRDRASKTGKVPFEIASFIILIIIIISRNFAGDLHYFNEYLYYYYY